jgi:hypothetical protein
LPCTKTRSRRRFRPFSWEKRRREHRVHLIIGIPYLISRRNSRLVDRRAAWRCWFVHCAALCGRRPCNRILNRASPPLDCRLKISPLQAESHARRVGRPRYLLPGRASVSGEVTRFSTSRVSQRARPRAILRNTGSSKSDSCATAFACLRYPWLRKFDPQATNSGRKWTTGGKAVHEMRVFPALCRLRRPLPSALVYKFRAEADAVTLSTAFRRRQCSTRRHWCLGDELILQCCS